MTEAARMASIDSLQSLLTDCRNTGDQMSAQIKKLLRDTTQMGNSIRQYQSMLSTNMTEQEKLNALLSRLKIQGSEVKRYLKNVSVRYIYWKMLILTFEDSEEEILNHIVSFVSTGTKAFQVVENARTELRFDGLEIDVAKCLVRKQKQEIDLTFTEFEILHLLARNPGRVFSKEQIYNSVWKEPYFGDYNIVMSHIRNIREKIEDNPSKPIYIQTVWGVGYKFNNKLK